MDVREVAMGRADQRHPWERARLAFVGGLVERVVGVPGSVLDVGSGDGYVLENFQQRFPGARVYGVEPELGSLPEPPRLPIVRTLDDVPPGRFDLILLLDVLEHVEDDVGFLAGLARDRLAAQGSIVATAPAHGWLFSEHDRFLKHHRRYSSARFHDLGRAAGLATVTGGQLFHSLFVARALQKLTGRVGTQGVARWSGGPLLSAAVTAVLRADTLLPTLLPGLSVFAVWRA